MKKRIVSFVFVLIFAVLCLAGCTGLIKPQNNVNYKALNSLSAKVTDYLLITETSIGADIMNGSFALACTDTGYTVDYSSERLKKIDLLNPTEGYKITLSGRATLENGEVVSFEGDKLEYLPGRLALSFDKSYFKDIKDEKGRFTASVTDNEGFFGKEMDVLNMTVEIEYTETSFTSIIIKYSTLSGAAVTAAYSFN